MWMKKNADFMENAVPYSEQARSAVGSPMMFSPREGAISGVNSRQGAELVLSPTIHQQRLSPHAAHP